MSALPTRDQLRVHPQLAVVAALTTHLALIEPALAAAHREGDTSAPCEQARSMLKVVRILQNQLDAYRGLLAVGDRGSVTRSTPRG